MNSMIWPFMVEVGLISWRSESGLHLQTGGSSSGGTVLASVPTSVSWVNTGVKRPPLPSELLAAMLAFGLFSAVASKNETVGQLLGWGIVIATAITMFSPSGNITNPTPPSSPSGGPPGTVLA